MKWVAFGIVVFLVKSRLSYLRFPSLRTASGPLPTVVIPARDEAANIGEAVGAFERCEVIVADDASSDRTASIAREAGARVIDAGPLPAGWLGKPNACVAGSRLCTSDWILFADADTRMSDELAASMVAHAEAQSLDLLSAFLHQECRTLAERCLMPYAFALYFCGVSKDSVLANGQCLLVRRSAYESIGGHAAVSGSAIEDVALAHVMSRRGIVRAEHMGSVRMYTSLAEIWRGFEKNSFRFLLANRRDGLQVVAASILLTSYIPLLFVYRWLAPLPLLLLRPWYGSWKESLLAVPAIYLFQAVALNAMFATIFRRKTLWKGRAIA